MRERHDLGLKGMDGYLPIEGRLISDGCSHLEKWDINTLCGTATVVKFISVTSLQSTQILSNKYTINIPTPKMPPSNGYPDLTTFKALRWVGSCMKFGSRRVGRPGRRVN